MRVQTQGEMGRGRGVACGYISMLEKNQRVLSLSMGRGWADNYSVDGGGVVMDKGGKLLADLRNAMQDPLFAARQPDRQEMRAAVDHAPSLVQNFLKLHQSHRTAMDNIMKFGNERMPTELLTASPEAIIHDFFRDHFNYFDVLEQTAEVLRYGVPSHT